MSEKLRSNEQYTDKLEVSAEAESKSLLKELERRAHEAAKNQQEQLKTAQRESLEQTDSSVEIKAQLEQHGNPDIIEHQAAASSSLKDITYSRSLRTIQARLSKPDKAMSKLMHTPAIDFVSQGLSKSVGRQYGLLGAGLAGFVGSSLLLWAAHTYGFEYSYFSVFGLFAIGYLLGILIEIGLKLKKIRR